MTVAVPSTCNTHSAKENIFESIKVFGDSTIEYWFIRVGISIEITEGVRKCTLALRIRAVFLISACSLAGRIDEREREREWKSRRS